MKNLFYLTLLCVFMACGGAQEGTGDNAPAAGDTIEKNEKSDAPLKVVACADDCKKACCLGCKATEGEKSCALLASADHSCCATKEAPPSVVEDAHAVHNH